MLPLLVAGLAWFLNRTKHGTAVRAAADNPDAARLSGISTKRVSFIVWSLAGGLAAVTTILSAPLANANVASTGALGPDILLRTLTVAVIAGMASMTIALGAGVVVGVVEALVFYNNPTDPGLINALLFVTVLVAVLVSSSRNRSLGMRERFSFAPRTRPVPESLRDNWLVRHHARIGAFFALLVAVVVPLVVTSESRLFLYSQILLMALVALSLTVLTGWAGQLSLGQFALVGIGGVTTYALFQEGLQFPVAVLVGAAVAALAAVVGRSPGAADARAFPRGHDAGPRRGHTVDPRTADLPDRRPEHQRDAAPDHRAVLPRSAAHLLLRVPRRACPRDRRRGPVTAQRSGACVAGRA